MIYEFSITQQRISVYQSLIEIEANSEEDAEKLINTLTSEEILNKASEFEFKKIEEDIDDYCFVHNSKGEIVVHIT